jgi:hypothetical protein
MGKPFKTKTLQTALCEIISAESALNMSPDPIKRPKGDFLSDRDKMVKHAIKHLHAAFAIIANEQEFYKRALAEIKDPIRLSDEHLASCVVDAIWNGKEK